MSVIMGITGAQNAPFYLALLFCVQMELFAKPTFSSFHRVNPHVRDKRHTIAMIGTERKITEGSSYIQRPLETVLLLFAAIMMPSSMYLWSHMRQIWYSFSAVHIVNVIMLVAIPLFMIGVNMRQYIWWSSAGMGQLQFAAITDSFTFSHTRAHHPIFCTILCYLH